MSVAETIRAKLTEALSPAQLEIVDESHLHAGHASAPAGGQRLVYGALSDELAGPVHALAITALAPGEADPPHRQ